MELIKEEVTPNFTKYITEYLPFFGAFHRFKGIDNAGEAHCHPWDFQTFILRGWYREKVYYIMPDGTWNFIINKHEQGFSHRVKAETIHEIIEFSEEECITYVITEPERRNFNVWKFNESGIWIKEKGEEEFKPFHQ